MDNSLTRTSESPMAQVPVAAATLPDGTVTLLMTDVEGSTVLWEADPAAMAAVMARHDELMRAAIDLHGGVRPVEQGEGDSVVAAFRGATDAVACALDVQRAFAAETWFGGPPIRVRMAVHTGQIMLRDSGNYFGPTIIRCARLRSLAVGGQVLVSATTRTVVAEAHESDVDFLDVGSHHLKGFDRPERVWQLIHPELEREFPPIRSVGAPPTNLPAQLSTFVGRESELDVIRRAIADNRLVTLTGAGGCGKTRLAFEAGSAEIVTFDDGVWAVELAAVTSGDLVAHAIAAVFGIREEFGRPMIDTLAEQLQGLATLVVIDNCEQVLGDVSAVVDRLLQQCPMVRVLATSREALGLTGEVTWRVPSLDESTGIELFVQRARSARPGFDPTAAEVSVIGDIVARLDGIPLAIELAAARVRMMSPARIAGAIEDRFRLLTGGNRTAMARQQTLEASVEWSYDLLDEAEQLLARRLSVMHGFTLEAAEEIAEDDLLDRYAVLDVLTRLVDKSIVQFGRPEVGYRFLETVRQYLQRRLLESGEMTTVRERHLGYFLSLAEAAAPDVAFGESAALLSMLESENDNLELALEFADGSGRREQALRLATALTLFWELRGHLGRAGRWFARLLDQSDVEPTSHRARACWGAAHVALYSGDFETMQIRAPEALELAEQVGDDWALARALNTLGFATGVMTPHEAPPLLERSIELGRRSGDDWSVLNSRKMLTVTCWATHDDVASADDLEQLRVDATRLDAAYFLAWYHGLVGMFLARRGEVDEARSNLQMSIELCDGFGEPITGSMARAWLWSVDIAQGNYADAEVESAALLQRASASGGELAVPDLLTNLGHVAIARGDAPGAAELLAPVFAEHREHGIPYSAVLVGTVLASARRRMGQLDAATELLDDLAELASGFDNQWMLALIDLERSCIAMERDDLDLAERQVHAALATLVRMGQRPDVATALDLLGCVARRAESEVEAVRCFAAAAALRDVMGIVALPPDAELVRNEADLVRELLGDDDVARHWAEGYALTMDEAVEYVSRARGERKRPSSGWASLTPTELRVVELVAEGLTNPQIAEKMFIARGTVKVHLGHIFTKLGVVSRSELAAQAARRTPA
jgi:predicted ATPase/class 3 adenylate cyclase/DNA-binding CsgD family transcriptional regulator